MIEVNGLEKTFGGSAPCSWVDAKLPLEISVSMPCFIDLTHHLKI